MPSPTMLQRALHVLLAEMSREELHLFEAITNKVLARQIASANRLSELDQQSLLQLLGEIEKRAEQPHSRNQPAGGVAMSESIDAAAGLYIAITKSIPADEPLSAGMMQELALMITDGQTVPAGDASEELREAAALKLLIAAFKYRDPEGRHLGELYSNGREVHQQFCRDLIQKEERMRNTAVGQSM